MHLIYKVTKFLFLFQIFEAKFLTMAAPLAPLGSNYREGSLIFNSGSNDAVISKFKLQSCQMRIEATDQRDHC